MTTPTFDLEGFIAFCRSKPADEVYAGFDAGTCALAQFGFRGATVFSVSSMGIPDNVYAIATRMRPFTFGALASRLANLEDWS